MVLTEALKAADLLEQEFGVAAEVWSCPSFVELARDGYNCERWNRLHPDPKARGTPYITECLAGHDGPVVAASDFVRAVPNQVRAFLPEGRRYITLGTDGYGRSDSRANLFRFFEVSAEWIAEAAVAALADDGVLRQADIARAIQTFGLDPDKPNPVTV